MRTSSLLSITLFLPTFALLNACGGGNNQKSIDLTPPVITLKGANPLQLSLNKTFTDTGATAVDNIDGDLTTKIIQTNKIKINKAACYQQQYSVTDTAGNSTKKTRIVFIGTDGQRHSPNQKPIAEIDNKTTEYNKVILLKPLENDSDGDCDTLSISSVTQASAGKAVINKKNNTISFDPKNNIGSILLTYTLSDNHGGSAKASIIIASHNPNDGNSSWPDVKNDKATTNKNTPKFINLLANDTDGDGDSLVLDRVDTPQHGSVIIKGKGVTYTPNLNYIGTDSFYYGVHDNHGHNGSALVTVTISK